MLERKPVGDILSLQDDAGRFRIVPCELGRAHSDGVRGPVLPLIKQILLGHMALETQRTVEHIPNGLAFGKDGFIRMAQ